jgi:hypothetical protein
MAKRFVLRIRLTGSLPMGIDAEHFYIAVRKRTA